MTNQRLPRSRIKLRTCVEAVKARYECLEIVGGVVHVPEAVLEHHLSDIFVRVSYPSFPMLFIVDLHLELENRLSRAFPRRG